MLEDATAYTTSPNCDTGKAMGAKVSTGAPASDGRICCMLATRRVRCGDQASVKSLQHAVDSDTPAAMLFGSGNTVPSVEVVVQNTVYDDDGERDV